MREVALVCLVVTLLLSAGLVGADETGSLEVEATNTGGSDTTTLTFTFVADANGTASVDPTFRDLGTGVSATYSGWSGGGTSGSSSAFTVRKGQEYTVEYEVTATNDATEDTYSFRSSVSGPVNYHTETLTVDVSVLEPDFGSINSEETVLTFTDQNTLSTEVDVGFSNTGDGKMRDIEATVSDIPVGLSVDASVPDELDANEEGAVFLDISAEETLSEGPHTFSVQVTDSMDNSESFDVTVDIEKEPVLSVSEDSIDFGDILIGQSSSRTIQLEESGGHESIDGIDVDYTYTDPEGSVSLDGIEDTFINNDETSTQRITIDVDRTADQHANLDWDVDLTPAAASGIGTSVSIEGRVIYPPYYESASLENTTITMDEPRDETSEFTQTVSMTVGNGGDQTMEITGITPTVSTEGVTATVTDRPETIQPQSEATISLAVTADSSIDEGESELSVAVDSVKAGEKTVTSTVTVEQETELTIDTKQLGYGEIVATQTVTRSTTINERLGYHDIENLTITQVAGPDSGWIDATDRPTVVAAGGSEAFVTTLTFDTTARFFSEETWVYQVNGDNVEAQNISVRAVPRPIDFTATVDEIRQYDDGSSNRATVADETAGAMEDLASLLRQNTTQSTRADVPTVSAAGRSTTLFLQYTEEAQTQIDNGNYEEAQAAVTRSAAAFNTMDSAAGRVSQPDIAKRLGTSVDVADKILDGLIADQRTYYQQRLNASNTTMLQRAQIYRQLAQLSALSGDQEQEANYRNESKASFERYSTLISKGNTNLQNARQNQSALESDTMMSVLGTPLFWIDDLNQVESERTAINASYNQAQEQFITAGAVSRAQTVRSQRATFVQRLERARQISFAIAGVLGVLFVVVVLREALAVYRYFQESAEAATGDFLLTHETS